MPSKAILRIGFESEAAKTRFLEDLRLVRRDLGLRWENETIRYVVAAWAQRIERDRAIPACCRAGCSRRAVHWIRWRDRTKQPYCQAHFDEVVDDPDVSAYGVF